MSANKARPGEPESLADVRDDLPYRLRVAARLLGRHPDTVYTHAREWESANPKLPRVILPKAFPNSPVQLVGAEILRQYGLAIIVKANRTSEGGETEAERTRRVAKEFEELMAACKSM